MTFFVEPGQIFLVTYQGDGERIHFPVPDITANTDTTALFINGLYQVPYSTYTVHQGTLSLTQGPLDENYTLIVRNH